MWTGQDGVMGVKWGGGSGRGDGGKVGRDQGVVVGVEWGGARTG